MYDQQDAEQAISTHARLWLDAPGEGSWLERLRRAAALAAYTQADTADGLARLVQKADAGPREVLLGLADLETRYSQQ
ncbi:hypothetical protein [Streptomyces anulatus]|uniref:hypothetical protein n=1 Tax=Streptomyces anulatus TaxID=1892 RepID=UPI001D1833C9|nr:hypothetical protein [Streptomyces anulatus]